MTKLSSLHIAEIHRQSLNLQSNTINGAALQAGHVKMLTHASNRASAEAKAPSGLHQILADSLRRSSDHVRLCQFYTTESGEFSPRYGKDSIKNSFHWLHEAPSRFMLVPIGAYNHIAYLHIASLTDQTLETLLITMSSHTKIHLLYYIEVSTNNLSQFLQQAYPSYKACLDSLQACTSKQSSLFLKRHYPKGNCAFKGLADSINFAASLLENRMDPANHLNKLTPYYRSGLNSRLGVFRPHLFQWQRIFNQGQKQNDNQKAATPLINQHWREELKGDITEVEIRHSLELCETAASLNKTRTGRQSKPSKLAQLEVKKITQSDLLLQQALKHYEAHHNKTARALAQQSIKVHPYLSTTGYMLSHLAQP